MKKKDSFIFYRDWFLAIDNLDNSIRLEVYDAIMHKVFGEEDIDLSPEAQIAIRFVTPMIERDINKYKQICERRKAFGRKGGVAKATKSYQKVTKGSKSQHVLASVADNDIQDTKVSMSISNNEIKEENTNVLKKKCPETDLEQAFAELSEENAKLKEENDALKKKKAKKAEKKFVPPTIEEVDAYIKEKGYHFDAKRFVEYYEADDWHYGVGSNRKKVANWKRCCQTWEDKGKTKVPDIFDNVENSEPNVLIIDGQIYR